MDKLLPLSYNCTKQFQQQQMIADPKRDIVVRLGMLDDMEKDKDGYPVTCRCIYIISPAKKVKAMMLYPMSTGHDFQELLRIVDSLLLVERNRFRVATPEGWRLGKRVMVAPSVDDAQLAEHFPAGVDVATLPSGRAYLRTTDMPQEA